MIDCQYGRRVLYTHASRLVIRRWNAGRKEGKQHINGTLRLNYERRRRLAARGVNSQHYETTAERRVRAIS